MEMIIFILWWCWWYAIQTFSLFKSVALFCSCRLNCFLCCFRFDTMVQIVLLVFFSWIYWWFQGRERERGREKKRCNYAAWLVNWWIFYLLKRLKVWMNDFPHFKPNAIHVKYLNVDGNNDTDEFLIRLILINSLILIETVMSWWIIVEWWWWGYFLIKTELSIKIMDGKIVPSKN